ncbi:MULTISPECIES: DUF7550 family protein [unclassified Haloparvum]
MTDHSSDSESDKRVTAPMQEFGGREVGVGAVILLVGLLVAYALPLLLG